MMEPQACEPGRRLLILAGLLALVSAVMVQVADSSSFLFAASLGTLAVSLLPWLVRLRAGWARQAAPGGGWAKTATLLLWASLLVGPLATGSMWVWSRCSDSPDGMARAVETLGVVVVAVASFTAAFWLALLAFVIQLWRHRWRPRLTAAVAGELLLVYWAYSWLVTA